MVVNNLMPNPAGTGSTSQGGNSSGTRNKKRRDYPGVFGAFLTQSYNDKNDLFGQAEKFLKGLDINRDGSTTVKELQEHVKSGEGSNGDSTIIKELSEIIERMDLNEDGVISKLELSGYKFAADANGDSKVTEKEAMNFYDFSVDKPEKDVKQKLREAFNELNLQRNRDYPGGFFNFLSQNYNSKKELLKQSEDQLKLIDKNKDGNTTIGEIVNEVVSGPGSNGDPGIAIDLTSALVKIDLNGDNIISKKELSAYKFATDENKDGKVSEDEAVKFYNFSVDGSLDEVQKKLQKAFNALG